METAVTTKPQDLPAIMQGDRSMFMDPATFAHAQRVALMLCSSTMVPEHFRGEKNLGNVLIAMNFASRCRIDPFMAMQNMYIVHGRPGLEAKMVIALVNASGKFTSLQFHAEGAGDKLICYAYATNKATGERCQGPTVSIAMAKVEGWTKNSKWISMPGLMIRYRSAAFFARIFCPEAIMGLQTADELHDAMDATPGPNGTYAVQDHIDKLNAVAAGKPVEVVVDGEAVEGEAAPPVEGSTMTCPGGEVVSVDTCNGCPGRPDCENFQ